MRLRPLKHLLAHRQRFLPKRERNVAAFRVTFTFCAKTPAELGGKKTLRSDFNLSFICFSKKVIAQATRKTHLHV